MERCMSGEHAVLYVWMLYFFGFLSESLLLICSIQSETELDMVSKHCISSLYDAIWKDFISLRYILDLKISTQKLPLSLM